MNKKVLVLTLALIVAFAGSAMAEVKFSGEITATASQKSLKVLQDEFDISTSTKFNVALSAKDNKGVDFTGEFTAWNKLGKYKLELKDDYFTAWVWGNGQNLTDKYTEFKLINAKKGPGSTSSRLRFEIPVMELATVTLDFEPKDTMRAFVEGKLEGFDIGLAYARKSWSGDSKSDSIVAYGSGAVDAGDYKVNLNAAAGVTLGDDLGLAFGFGADTNVTEQIKVEGSVTNGNGNFKGDAVTKAETVLFGKGTYTDENLEAWASAEYTIADPDNSNVIEAGATYRFSDKLTFDRQFHKDHWYKNTAPAVGVTAKFADMKFDNVGVKVAAPVVENMVWLKAEGTYKGDSKFEADALGHILATKKLTIMPSAKYDSESKSVDAVLAADYKIGTSSTVVSVKAGKLFNEAKDGAEILEAKVTVKF